MISWCLFFSNVLQLFNGWKLTVSWICGKCIHLVFILYTSALLLGKHHSCLKNGSLILQFTIQNYYTNLYFFLIIYSSAGLTCYKFVKYFKIQQVQALETLYFRTIAYSYRLNHLNTGIFDWIIIRNDLYRIISYIFINSM